MKYVIHEGLVVGRVFNQGPFGWSYMPFNSAQRTSRKGHPTPEAAIRGRTKGKIIEATTIADAQAKATAAFLVDHPDHCPECRRKAPGHKINCKTGNAKATAYQTALGKKHEAPEGMWKCMACSARWKNSELLQERGHMICGDATCGGSVLRLPDTNDTKPAPVEIEVCERLMDHGWLPHVEDGVYKGLRQVPKYHASIKGKKHWGCGMSPGEAIGSLIQSHPEMFNIKVTHLVGKLPR